MKLRLAALALCAFAWAFLGAAPARANCTTPCTKAQILTDINANWPDNTAGAITPAVLRSTVLDLVNSYVDVNGASSFTCPSSRFLTAIATLSTFTCGQPSVSDISGGAALTKVDDTNVTVTLGGTPASALLAATSITLGWTGTLSVARGGTGDSGTAWSTFSASVTCGTASISVTSTRSKSIGKTVFVELDFTISTIGSCTNAAQFTLPSTAQSGAALAGQESVTTGKAVTCRITPASATSFCLKADASTFSAGDHYLVSGIYESQ